MTMSPATLTNSFSLLRCLNRRNFLSTVFDLPTCNANENALELYVENIWEKLMILYSKQ